MQRFLALPIILAAVLVSLAPAPAVAQPASSVFATREGNTRTIVIYGSIGPETETVFTQLLAANQGARVMLNSAGGSLTPALNIGRLIRDSRLETFVPDASGCFSACALIFLAGTERNIGQGARVGFHAAYVPQQGGPGQVSSSGNAVIGAYLSRLGFNDGAIRFLTAARPEQISIVKPVQFQEFGIGVRQVASRLPTIPAAPPTAASPAKNGLAPPKG
ncbi:MAG: hypothetical protein JWR10_1433 [Rubritepida sp.]|nr:hypothetical protein [Rubritepida sp.]